MEQFIEELEQITEEKRKITERLASETDEEVIEELKTRIDQLDREATKMAEDQVSEMGILKGEEEPTIEEETKEVISEKDIINRAKADASNTINEKEEKEKEKTVEKDKEKETEREKEEQLNNNYDLSSSKILSNTTGEEIDIHSYNVSTRISLIYEHTGEKVSSLDPVVTSKMQKSSNEFMKFLTSSYSEKDLKKKYGSNWQERVKELYTAGYRSQVQYEIDKIVTEVDNKRLEALKEENAKLREENQKLNNDNQELKKQNDNLVKENQNLQKENKENDNKVNKLQEENDGLISDYAELLKENRSLQEERDKAKKESQDKDNEIRKLQEENAKLREEATSLKSTNEGLKHQTYSILSATRERLTNGERKIESFSTDDAPKTM